MPIPTATTLLEEYTDLKTSLHELETKHEGLFMQRLELENAASDKLTEFKNAVKSEGLTYLANSKFIVTAEQTYKKTSLDASLLAERKPLLLQEGIITTSTTINYLIDKKRLKGAMEAGIISQADIDACTPERTPHAYPVTIKPSES